MKRIVLVLLLLFALAGKVHAADANGAVSGYMHRVPYRGEENILLRDDIGYVASHVIEKAYSAKLRMEEGRVVLTGKDTMISLPTSGTGGSVNGVLLDRKVGARIEAGKVYLPVRAIAEIFGDRVEWDPDARVILVEETKTPVKHNYYHRGFRFSLFGERSLIERIQFRKGKGGIDIYIDGRYGGEIVIADAPEIRSTEGFLLDYKHGKYYEYRRSAALPREIQTPLEALLMTFERQ
ncbi:Copper amine oxidase N-terminal domain [Aedoeadaptatus ivorii]|uniref:Copper amine oxidase N-terminal domain n=1 Tax=Aedoeadaptatus ivorii TaxID=54006 RepID=A0A3S4Y854_9FIRM|nr:stalk domain-containing protein [Peptoniphilus ivorii]MDQ0508272.1 hypothetical protein [Peptoniphilus ivorii]VEJ36246.1 Copper amine oxidase N-terminal domain [Peptoniphilus ivorii]